MFLFQHLIQINGGLGIIRKIFLLIFIGLIVIAILIFEPFRSEPPTPSVTIGDVDIPTTQGSFCWKGLISGQCVDKIYTSPLEMAAEHKPTVVSSNEEVTIKFKKAPLGKLVVTQWVGENNTKSIIVKNDKFKVPKEKGIYVYHVTANWEKGSGSYAFSIEVK